VLGFAAFGFLPVKEGAHTFDVRMETVVHHLASGMIHRADEAHGLRRGRQEVVFEPVQALDRQ